MTTNHLKRTVEPTLKSCILNVHQMMDSVEHNHNIGVSIQPLSKTVRETTRLGNEYGPP